MDHGIFPNLRYMIGLLNGNPPLLLGLLFHICKDTNNVERSTRTIFKPGERSNLSSSLLSRAAFRRAWWDCTIDESSRRSPPAGTAPLHGSLRIPDIRTSSDPIDVSSLRSGHRSFSSSISSLHVPWTRNGYISRLTRPTYYGFLGLLLVSDVCRPLLGAGPPRFLDLGPFPLSLGRSVSGLPRYPNYPGWIPPNTTFLGSLRLHAQKGGLHR